MSGWMEFPRGLGMRRQDFACNTRIKSYPNGTTQILVCDREIFGRKDWEDTWSGGDIWAAKPTKAKPKREEGEEEGKAATGSVERSMRRARSQVRDYALCTPFKYFVTLTLDREKVDRYDVTAITKKLRVWADNQVRRKGLTYILVPERHKDGAIHFHGFFNDALPVVDSGTLTMAGWKAPKKPRSAAQRHEWLKQGANPVYNLPAWTLGFTTAIELYGTYEAAVSYVCKYIGKDMQPDTAGGMQPQKIGGRWYYSGGDLRLPEVAYCNGDLRALEDAEGAYRFDIKEAGLSFVQVTVKTSAIAQHRRESGEAAPSQCGAFAEVKQEGGGAIGDTGREHGARAAAPCCEWRQERIAGYL